MHRQLTQNLINFRISFLLLKKSNDLRFKKSNQEPRYFKKVHEMKEVYFVGNYSEAHLLHLILMSRIAYAECALDRKKIYVNSQLSLITIV